MFTGGFQVGNQRDVDIQSIFPAHFVPHLPDGLDKGLAFDVADGAADLRDDYISLGSTADIIDKALDLIRDVWDGLHGSTQIFAPALLGEDIGIDLAGGQIGVFVQILVNETLVMTQIKICFGSILGHIDLAVLIRTHGTGVNIDIGVQLLCGHLQPPCFEQTSQRRRRNTFTQTGYHTTGHENIFCHIPASREKLTKKEEGVHQGTKVP